MSNPTDDNQYIDIIKKNTLSTLQAIGENPDRDGLIRTPERYAKALEFLTSGNNQTVSDAVGNGIFEDSSSEIVLVRDIELFSLCEHHLLPFSGKAHVAYLPNGRIIGLSKIARIVDLFARRLQVQERLTTQISEALMETLNPLGIGVIIEASHFCMMMRGVQKQHSKTVTSSMLGAFREDPKARQELLQLLTGLH